jgi:hypothetical protein
VYCSADYFYVLIRRCLGDKQTAPMALEEVAQKVFQELTLAGRGPAPQLQVNDLALHVAQVSDLRKTFSATS